ncbi:hypothetical protein Acor_49970 [Acrocarpospora corrugata]|uniref:Lipoprotein n=1 Tax=Acrocarpospora corrugata TaxID=35763 RepID=A0A5M3W6V3_9ACTN|nr:hypothetical protein [Acrocarpospora corrugata]GES02931.1 hypothetical protein Acor_49970 [Acrocarpospora corrugata]
MRSGGWRGVLGATALTVVLAACQIPRSAIFSVVNDSAETVVVTRSGMVYATLPPTQSRDLSFPENRCAAETPPPDEFKATSASGREYVYGHPACNGNTWRIGVSPSGP